MGPPKLIQGGLQQQPHAPKKEEVGGTGAVALLLKTNQTKPNYHTDSIPKCRDRALLPERERGRSTPEGMYRLCNSSRIRCATVLTSAETKVDHTYIREKPRACRLAQSCADVCRLISLEKGGFTALSATAK